MLIDSGQSSQEDVERSSGRGRGRLILFVLGLLAVAFAFSYAGDTNVATRDLIDTDGYMRYLRIERLMETGGWFDSTYPRSNHPFGEVQHWTRPLDMYVIGLAGLLMPVAGDDALYWASYLNAPLLLLGMGLCLLQIARQVAPRYVHLTLPVFLMLPMVIAYGVFGRVDHHAPILLMFTVSLMGMLRLTEDHDRRWAVALGLSIAVGLWVSTEYLIPIALVGMTLAWFGPLKGLDSATSTGSQLLGVAALASAVALFIERGTQFTVVEYDKLSIVHVVALTLAWGVFVVVEFARRGGRRPQLWFFAAAGLGGVLLLLIYPDLLGGPFVDVDHRARTIWLQHVGELRPIWGDRTWASRALVLTPTVLGLASAAWLRSEGRLNRTLRILAGWLIAYAALSAAQVRWAVFAHVIAAIFIMLAIGILYGRIRLGSWTVLVRPLLIVALLFGPYAGAIALDSVGGGAAAGADCALEDILPAVSGVSPTVVLANQDLGPELMYRTRHNVIATPYHRNDAGILYVHDVMSMPTEDPESIRQTLADRDIGLIAVCPGESGTLQPSEGNMSGSLYAALTDGEPPGGLRELDAGRSTDFRLFTVDS